MRLRCFIAASLFAGRDDGTVEKRRDDWDQWWKRNHRRLDSIFQISRFGYSPGEETWLNRDNDEVQIHFPEKTAALVPKGLLVRQDILSVLDMLDRDRFPREDSIYAYIDGSGAFRFRSLMRLLRPFYEDSSTEVVLGYRPPGKSGMTRWRKAIEEFEQFLLFQRRPTQLQHSFSEYDLSSKLLPDGQAGCWAFRFSVAKRLPLTARGYAIEYDLISSAVEAGLRICYTRALAMNLGERVTTAGGGSIGGSSAGNRSPETQKMPRTTIALSLEKLRFISHKLDMRGEEIWKAWEEFTRVFADSERPWIPVDYVELLEQFCFGGRV